MRFMMIVKSDSRAEAGVLPNEKELADMGTYNELLVKAGALLAAEGLQASSKGARVRVSGKKTSTVDGPFAEAKELAAGFWVIQTETRAEAVEWAKQVPFTEGEVELRQLYEAEDFAPDAAQQPAPAVPPRQPGTRRFVALLKADRNTEASMPPNEKLMTEMGALMVEMAEKGILLAGDGLKPTVSGARVLYSGAKRTIVDGPFSETKEIVAGYTIVQTKTRAEAVEFARRMLQIHVDGTGIDGGEVEIRQVFELEDFGPGEAVEHHKKNQEELSKK